MIISSKDIKAFQTKILSWYKKNKRDLPWRDVPVGTSLDQKAYRILVSEVMLQQTQVSRVIPKYESWFKAFPTLEILVQAKTSEVLRLWSGLGYNRRALYLQKCAKALEELRIKNYELRKKTNKDTFWPKTIEELKKLPGIGEYTAAAVACFAFDLQVVVIDTNIRKVIILLLTNGIQLLPKNKELGIMNKGKVRKKTHNSLFVIHHSKRNEREVTLQEITEVAKKLLPVGRAAEWNQALMDYASAMLKKEKIPLVRQSTFKGSNRYYRGQIIKILLEKKEISVQELSNVFQKEETFVNGIVQGLVKEGMVKIMGKQLFIESG